MKELYPPPPAVKKDEDAEKAKDDDNNKGTDADKDASKGQDLKPKNSAASNKTFQDSQPVTSSWARGRGNFFLVDRQSRSVIWSIYERPKNSTPDELAKT